VVCAAGNLRGTTAVDVSTRAPAGLARAASFPNQLIVVGSVDANGVRSNFVNSDTTPGGGIITQYVNRREIQVVKKKV